MWFPRLHVGNFFFHKFYHRDIIPFNGCHQVYFLVTKSVFLFTPVVIFFIVIISVIRRLIKVLGKMTYPGMAFVFVVGVGLATILYYMFADNSHNQNQHGYSSSNGSGPPPDIPPNSWSVPTARYCKIFFVYHPTHILLLH